MIVQVIEASRDQQPVLERLMQIYLYEFSAIEGFDVGGDGLFEYQACALDCYWAEADRSPFLIYIDDRLAGFAMVNAYTVLDENKGARSIAEFFVMGRYRRKGVGKRVAFDIFDRFRGKWEVREIQDNDAGQKFWRSVIGEYTGGLFTEKVLDEESWRGPIQSFDSSLQKNRT